MAAFAAELPLVAFLVAAHEFHVGECSLSGGVELCCARVAELAFDPKVFAEGKHGLVCVLAFFGEQGEITFVKATLRVGVAVLAAYVELLGNELHFARDFLFFGEAFRAVYFGC